MMRPLPAALVAVLASAPLSAQESPAIRSVDVTVELENVDANALDLWPEIDGDLTQAIEAAVGPAMADEGYSISVVLNEISLGGAPVLAETGEFNRLGGWIYVREDEGTPPVKSENIVLDASGFTPGGTSQILIIPGRPEFYNALLNVFAIRTFEEVQELR